VFVIKAKNKKTKRKNIVSKQLNISKSKYKSKITKSINYTFLGFIFTFIALGFTFYEAEYPKLNVEHQIDEKNGTLNIFIENNAKLKKTGIINFYRLDISEITPYSQLDSLSPGQNHTFTLGINTDNINYNMSYRLRYDEGSIDYIFPQYKLLYSLSEQNSISYKITCDNCFSQGIIKRIPDFQKINGRFVLDSDYIPQNSSLTKYSWVVYSPKDLP